MGDSNLGRLWRHLSRVLRGEVRITAKARDAILVLLAVARDALRSSGMDASVLDDRMGAWREALRTGVLPAIEDVFTAAWQVSARGVDVDPGPYAARHLESVWNRLVGVSDEVFDAMRLTLQEGREAGEGIPELAARVDTLLADHQRWTNRATVIARTEVIAANNAGSYASGEAVAKVLGHDRGVVAKQWLATGDTRTRETHREANGQTVMGLDTPFQVGESMLQYAADPNGAAAEVIQCRCAVLYLMPGDPGYPTALTAAGGTAMADMSDDAPGPDQGNTSTVVVALPAADDPVQGIGPEQKHATLLWFGEVDDATADAIRAAVAEAQDTDQWPTLTVPVKGVGELGDDDPPASVVLLAPDDGDTSLEGIRSTLIGTHYDTVREAWEGQRQWPTFTPHVTLGYGPDVTDDDKTTAAELTAITFDRLAVWQGDRQDEYPLTGATTEETPMPDTEAVTAAAGDPMPVVTPMAAGDPMPALTDTADLDDRFHGVMVIEDQQTGDGRGFVAGSLEWGTLPMPVGWQPADAPGHDDAIIVGRFDTIERVGNEITYTGTWDLEGMGWETRRLVAGQFLRGLSVDVDDAEAVVVDAATGEETDPFMAMMGEGDTLLLAVTRGRIRSATLCRVPAFEGTWIANGLPEAPAAETAPMTEDEVAASVAALTAAATRQQAPDATVFADPGFSVGDPRLVRQPDGSYGCPFTVTASGEVYGHLALWGTCHIAYDGACVTPPYSNTNYAYFRTGQTLCADGTGVPVGQITMGTGHADTRLLARPALEHYDNTGTVVADITTGEDQFGIWVAGQVRPSLTEDKVAELRASRLSGDWRRLAGNLELVAALAVNVGGFPIARVAAGLDGGDQLSLVAAGVVAPAPVAVAPLDPEVFAVQVLASMARRQKFQAAAARVRTRRVAAAAARVRGGQ